MDEALQQLRLRRLRAFGEPVETGENRDCEQLHALYSIEEPLLDKQLARWAAHWAMDKSTEVFQEEEDLSYTRQALEAAGLLLPPPPLPGRRRPATDRLLLLGEAGVGKSALLQHLFRTGQQAAADVKVEQECPLVPILVRAPTVHLLQKEGLGLLSAIAHAALQPLRLEEGQEEDVEERLLNALHVRQVLLLVDDLDLLPAGETSAFLMQFVASESSEEEGQAKKEKASSSVKAQPRLPKGRLIFVAAERATRALVGGTSRAAVLANFKLLQLEPGFTFNILVTAQIRSLLQKWPMIEASGDMHHTASRWSAFEDAMRAHYQKLCPPSVISPVLLFILARRLAKGASSDGNDGSDREFSIQDLLEDLYDDCLRAKHAAGLLPPARDSNECERESEDVEIGEADGVSTDGRRENALESRATDSSGDEGSRTEEGEDSPREESPQAAEKRREKEREDREERESVSFPLLTNYDLELGHLKRLCSLVGYLCHWFTAHSLELSSSDSLRYAEEPHLIGDEHMTVVEFIALQLQRLLDQADVASLLGFTVSLGDEEEATTPSGVSLDDATAKQLVLELFGALADFYQLTSDGNARPVHQSFQEFLAARFLTEPSFFTSSVMASLASEVPSRSGGPLFLAPFCWAAGRTQTSWWWDGVFQFAGLRRGVLWLGNKVVTSKGGAEEKEADSPFLRWLGLLRQGYDSEDLGQVRFQLLLRCHSTVCNHRPSHETHADPVTEAMGQAFLKLAERSSTVLIHLEVFPNYFLSGFRPMVAHTLIKKCINVFVHRTSRHAVHLISKFHFSPYLQTHLEGLLDLFDKAEYKTRLAVFNLLQMIDDMSLEKSHVAAMVKMLADDSGVVRREVVTALLELGRAASAQIKTSLLADLFPDGDTQPVISNAITEMSCLVAAADSGWGARGGGWGRGASVEESTQQMLYSKHFGTVTALLEQSDPGARLLGYLCFGSPNFRHNDHPEDGIPARRAALRVCTALGQVMTPTPIFDQQQQQQQLAQGQQASEGKKAKGGNLKGDYFYIVALNTAITRSLGEVAACWASSVIDMLKFKRQLVSGVNARALSQLVEEREEEACKVVEELFFGSNTSASVRAETLRAMLLLAPRRLAPLFSLLLRLLNVALYPSGEKEASAAPDWVLLLAMKAYHRAVVAQRSLLNVSWLVATIEAGACMEVTDEATRALHDSCTQREGEAGGDDAFGHLQESDIDLLLGLLERRVRFSQTHFVVVDLLRILGGLPPSLLTPHRLPLAELLSSTVGSVRQQTVVLVDRQRTHLTPLIPQVAALLATASSSTLGSGWVRSGAAAALACLARRGALSEVLSALVPYLSGQQSPSTLEAAIRCLAAVGDLALAAHKDSSPANAAHSPAGECLALTARALCHPDLRVTVAVLDGLESFGSWAANGDCLPQVVEFLAHEDTEIRSATENFLTALRPHVEAAGGALLLPHAAELLERWVDSAVYYVRQAALKVFELLGSSFAEAHAPVLVRLLEDDEPCVVLDALRSLRAIFDDGSDSTSVPASLSASPSAEEASAAGDALAARAAKAARAERIVEIFYPSVQALLEDSSHAVRAQVLRLIACNKRASTQAVQHSGYLLTRYFENIKVKRQAVLVLSLAGALDDAFVASLVDMTKTRDPKTLAEVSNTFARAGLDIVRLVPKMIAAVRDGQYAGVKRKFVRFVKPHERAAVAHFVEEYSDIVAMGRDADSVVRRKAAELLSFMAARLRELLDTEEEVNKLTKVIVRELVLMTLDKNVYVHKDAAVALSNVGLHHPTFVPDILDCVINNREDPYNNILVWRMLSLRWHMLIAKAEPRRRPRLDRR